MARAPYSKNAQIRWNPTDLEALAIRFCLTKCHFYTAWTERTVTIYSDCTGLRGFKAQSLASMTNKLLIAIKLDLAWYRFQVCHIPGRKNLAADALSRRPVWLTGKGAENDSAESDHLEKRVLGYLVTHCHNGTEDNALRAMTSATHLLKGNPLLMQIEDMGRKDPEYSLILHTVRTNGSIKDLPSESEGARMGGEWSRLDVMDEADIV